MSKKFSITMMVLCLTIGLIAGAFAASNNEVISALLNRDITITYNGQVQSFADVNGTVVYPLSYNGTTYLPVRAVCNMVNVAVDYDSASNTVILGNASADGQPVYLVDKENSGTKEYNYIIDDPSMLKFSGSDATQEYKNGVVYEIWNGFGSAGITSDYCYFDVAGYSEVSFTAAASDTKVNAMIVDQDGNVLSRFDVAKGEIVSKTIMLNGVQKIALVGNGYGSVDKGKLFIYEPVLK